MSSPKNIQERRRFLTTAGVGIVSLMGSQHADGSVGSAVDQPEVRLVKDFLLSWSSDLKTVLSYLAEDCEFRFTQWGPHRTGHAGIADAISTYVERPRAVITKIFDCSSAGPVVMAHYENRYIYENGDLIWEGAGTFFIKGDKIKEWRGYTIRVA